MSMRTSQQTVGNIRTNFIKGRLINLPFLL
nr:MAG TPA: hypothetical protein [Caudoviricetes sp.]